MIDADSDTFKPTKTVFKCVGRNDQGRRIEIPPTPSVLLDNYLDEKIITHLVNASNSYRDARKKEFPDKWIWKK